MRFGVLGPILVEKQGDPVRLGGRRQRAVLALLLAKAGRPLSVEAIAAEIWPDQSPDAVRDSLYVYVSQLRKVVGRERLTRVEAGYRLVLAETDELDSESFERLCAQGHRLLGTDPDLAAARFENASQLWRGDGYEEFADVPALALENARLAEMRLAAREGGIEAQLAAGVTPELGALARLCGENPYRESLWGLWARSLYRAGRQADALSVLNNLRAVLGEELGIEPAPETTRLEERILLHDPALDVEADLPPTNLPVPVSSFTGRVEALDELAEVMASTRLVTVLGPGGAGKTRLAIEVARRDLGRYQDGVWFVDLARVADPARVSSAAMLSLQLAEQVGVDPIETLSQHLRARSMLLVFDNCEHVASMTASVATSVLEASPRTRVLATSRVALGVSGEVQFTLGGLETSGGDEELSEAEALFASRASEVLSGFGVTSGNRSTILSICRHLDGLPLAIELAAARVNTLTPVEIERHLSDRFALLTQDPTPRDVHRSLRASMDWSYELLSPRMGAAFAALGVFEGPFRADAANAVMASGSVVDSLNRLQALVESSLLQVQHRGGEDPLYRLLETQRIYAREKLADEGAVDEAVARHDHHFAESAAHMRESFFGRGRVAARQLVESELADYEMAFDRLIDRGDVRALAMGWTLGHVWLFSGDVLEGDRRVNSLLRAFPDDRSVARADSLTTSSFLAMYVSDYDRSIERAKEAISIYRDAGDRRGLAYALARAGHAAFSAADGETAVAMLMESIQVCREIGYDDGLAWPVTLLAQARRWAGVADESIREDLEEGRERFAEIGETYGQAHADLLLASLYEEGVEYRMRYAEEMVELSQAPGADRLIRSPALLSLANAVWDSADRDRAEGLNRAAFRSALETGATVNIGLDILQAATFAGHRGDAERAALLFGAGDRYFVMAKAPFMVEVYGAAIESATNALGHDRYRELYQEGAAMSIEDATRYILGS